MTRFEPPRVRALQLERRAWAYAVEGEEHDAEASLAAAELVLHDQDDRPNPDWAMWVDDVELQIMAGRCWTVLRRPLRAISLLDQALRAYDDTHGRDKGMYLMFQANAYGDANEVEKACEVASRAMALSSGVGSVRPHQMVGPFVRRLEPHDELPAVAEFIEYAAAWVRQLPSLPSRDTPAVPLRLEQQ